jgi:hypothetical protein
VGGYQQFVVEPEASIFRFKVSKVRMESSYIGRLQGRYHPDLGEGESSQNAVLGDRNGEQELWSFNACIFFYSPCGVGLEYLHHSPASCRRQQKGNLVLGGTAGPPFNTVILTT